jgi:prepilin-type processing-associated H-X9-DG protein
VSTVGRSDYCANAYHYWPLYYPKASQTLIEAAIPKKTMAGGGIAAMDAGIFNDEAATRALSQSMALAYAGGYNYPLASKACYDFCHTAGPFYSCSTVTVAQISDGTSNVLMFGEKAMNSDYYLTGEDHGDAMDCYSGLGPDNSRYCANNGTWGDSYGFLVRDTPGYGTGEVFGGPHVGGTNMVFCDGSVHVVSFGISGTVLNALGNRKDGATIDISTLYSN